MAKRTPHDTLSSADAAPAGPGVSDTLRETREALGYELADVARMLRIRYPYLQAIEDGRFEDLPGATYVVGFLRSYAEYLGLDPDAVAARYKEEAAGNLRRQQLYLPTPAPEGRIPGGTVLLGTMVLAGIVYGGWYYLSATDRSVVDLVPVLPDRLVSLLDPLPYGDPARTEAGLPGAAPAPAQTAALAPEATALTPSAPMVPALPPSQGGASTAVIPPAPVVPGMTTVPAQPAPIQTAALPPAAAPVPPAAAHPAPSVPAAPAPAPAPVAVSAPAVVPAAPVSVAPPAAAAVQAAVPPSAIVPPADGEEEDGEAAQEPTPLSPTAPALAAIPPAPQPAPNPSVPPVKVYGSQNQASRVQLRASQDSWVQVRDREGEIIFTRVLRAGEVYRVPDRPGIRLRTGNAGGLTVMTDGVEGAPLGAVGQVMREVQLDPQTPAVRASAAN
ncbi:helix-turn-helix domain-containing protein [Azospirillum sp. SYSU D00513]|uniref:helix-turn-helix domain-containing protein n=1 Tax=Azospirillum sp. SYSU D00513 TaxID=2812561 RepID=UPI001A97039E|nr:helix-turn-helix domain-containing protein [Azospirillum sp. SYSU D00513]